jgi:spore germination cell wall hydrolase CwlJ-like protein
MKNLKQKAKVFLGICLVVLTTQLDNPQNAPKGQSTSGFVVNKQHIETEKKCIKEALYYEARGEGEQGMRAVLAVIHNRTKAKGFPETYCKVIHQPLQFSYRNGTRPGIHIEIKPVKASDKVAYDLVSIIAEDAVNGRLEPLLGPDVLWYHTKDVKPRWSRFMKRVKTISKHHFFSKE